MASLVVVLVLAALSIKKGRASQTPNNPACVELDIPIHVDTTVTKWLQPQVDSTYDAVDWIRYQTTRTKPNVTESNLGLIHINETFTINAQLCIPPHGPKSHILQIATHGAGFDRRYWDNPINPPSYSYLHAALSQGYSLLTYSRLGTGLSSKPSAYTTTQLPIHIAILHHLTLLSTSGSLLQYSKPLSTLPPNTLPATYTPTKIIHLGHSLGSIISLGFVSAYPHLSSGLIATGFLPTATSPELPHTLNVATWGFEYARENDPAKFAEHGAGYLVQGTPSNVELSFMGRKESFEPEMLQYAYDIRQPVGVSEFTSLLGGIGAMGMGMGSGGNGTGPGEFKGVVQFVVGEEDYGGCGGDCKGVYDLEEIRGVWKGARAVGVNVQPGTGHGLTLARNATGGYAVTFGFLEEGGL